MDNVPKRMSVGEKILITGASGFVGSFLVAEALKSKLSVFAGIRSTSSKRWLQDERIQFVELDLSDKQQLNSRLEEHNFDYVIHNAGVTASASEAECLRVNADFTKNFAECCAGNRTIKKFSFMSSLAAYGPADYQDNNVLDMNSSAHPVTAYGRSKLRAEQYIKNIKNLPYLIFRPTGIFGPRESDFLTVFKTINKGIAPHIGLTDQWLSLIYVKDLANVLVKATTSEWAGKEYFVTDGNLYKATQFNSIIAKCLGKNPIQFKIPLPLVYLLANLNEGVTKLTGKPSIFNRDKYAEIKARNLDCDISNLVRDFDFRPKYDLETAINETVGWYKENKWL